MDNGDRLWILLLLCAIFAANLPGREVVALVLFICSLVILVIGFVVRGDNADKA